MIEAAGSARAFETALDLTAPGGTTVTVGLPAPDARASVSPLVLTAQARTIVGSYWGPRSRAATSRASSSCGAPVDCRSRGSCRPASVSTS